MTAVEVTAPPIDPQNRDVRERNRRTLRVLIGIVAALVVAALLVGIRW